MSEPIVGAAQDEIPERRPSPPPMPPLDGPAVAAEGPDSPEEAARKQRRRGSRGGRGRARGPASELGDGERPTGPGPVDARTDDLPDPPGEGRTGTAVGARAIVKVNEAKSRPRIGDVRPAPKIGDTRPPADSSSGGAGGRRAGSSTAEAGDDASGDGKKRRRRGGRGRSKKPGVSGAEAAVTSAGSYALDDEAPIELDEDTLERRRGRERKGRPVGRYLMAVHVRPGATQIAVLEGRALIEHYVSRPQDSDTQIDGNIYIGRVQNVLPGMEAAFIDIGTPKNAVLYRGDIRYDPDDVEQGSVAGRSSKGKAKSDARIEQLLRTGQTVLCQVTKNPIGTKGARLTQEVSLPGRFCVLIPNSDTYGISKRLSDDERKRLRKLLDEVKPPQHGIIVRTAAEGATTDELRRDVLRLVRQWDAIEALAQRSKTPALLYAEPDMAVRVIREEFNREYRSVVIDDPALYEEVRDYVGSISPELADRVELYDAEAEGLPIFEKHHVHEQLHKALDRKVWLASGGSLIIERTEALTVIDVNTGKNVGSVNLEETVYRNNLEAAEEIARQLRLRDIGGIIVIDFIDMEIHKNRDDVIRTFRAALARDKTRTQVFDISELGLVEMTRKRVSEGLVESLSELCPACAGRGLVFDESLL
ncbi:MAG: Ribonuclease E [uncultured Acidimicrobiales bacterium]|uniref:Ribonuclease E n=1 Tax=uncultured Acidimicrobiales bacterium TaxID=310071 RepID=A0A6J4J118_9ACTN|nr:MAG: Ribonuclease E [uncultured Acidimicrobiales bacterium]